MTATAGSNANSVCGLRNLGAYVVIKTFVGKDGGNNNVNLVLMRDPVGSSGYTGAWKHDDALWTTANKALVPYGVDPTATAWRNKGFFVVSEA
jgi:hypothetical protein